ncbi:RNA cytidine acetyltransferase isoform X3 [Ostrinia furnacalis]|uniref:RNA cytidine acetyltransferase isoform X1 n=1 Tax=Ostrinia furnacalis TaxID=93504 RepID=UPI00103D5D45|nr:RNA cytidine acetyltransferase isoform X1 [Ostrinia furnacalis]XP_028171321.1 RNA cytidine acetyltransferase isoform X2 [Ostrinia furnacalis]XP_028171329.1 RNA cytidine acetyltransferase isoform X3 [Ostrinia furnacalis]
MVKKKIDNRIRVMIENGVKLGHRTMFLLVGDKSRDQVPILYDMLLKSTVKARPTVLWCYKNKDEAISNHGRKRAKKIAAGKLEVSEESLFDAFRVATTIHGRYYSESHAMLGQTYGVCVLQDFEALTPNLMARTIETVEGGGLIIFLLKTMDSLRQLHSITMDVHSRFKTEAHDAVVNRFNERFLLSLADNPRCLILDDNLTVLPISSKTAQVEPVHATPERVNPKLTELVSSLSDSPPAGPLVALCRTYDQATALVALINTLADKQSRPPHCLTAARGRGKSACLGLAVSAAVALGYVNIYVTSPHPENLITLFEFVLKGLDACLYQEHIDYNIVRSTNPDFKKAIVRINIARNSRQTVQYITPDDHSLLAAADLVLVDEAAAIPLAHVSAAAQKAPLALLSSTVSGYEGTGRALSLKLFAQLQNKHNAPPPIKLEEPIRYRAGDPVESWLNSLLCLEAPAPSIGVGAPPPAACELYRVNRDALFCYHRAAEAFLHRLVAIYVASHYKNSPNDIQLLADAPAHCLFVLLAPTPPNATSMPEVLCVIQLCLEGSISEKSVKDSLGRGRKAAGDLIPWNICEQFGDKDFPKLSGARIVRIATHPSYQRMGYGKRALQQLASYYSGDIPCLDEPASDDEDQACRPDDTLHTETIVPRAKPPTLLKRLSEVRAEELDYLGTSFGLTEELIKFWKSQKYVPVYLSQKANELTGEHSCIMLRALGLGAWLAAYSADFRRRLARLLARSLRKLPAALALTTMVNDNVAVDRPVITKQRIAQYLSGHDLGRLEAYCRQQADYRLVCDLLQPVAELVFHCKANVKLDAVQQVILIAMGFQMKDVDDIAGELGLPGSQILAKFYEACKKINAAINAVLEDTVAKEIGIDDKSAEDAQTDGPVKQSLQDELSKAAKELERKQRKELSRLMGEDLAQYRIKGSEVDWQQSLAASKQKHLVSVKSGEKRLGDDSKEIDDLIDAHNNKAKKKKKHSRN